MVVPYVDLARRSQFMSVLDIAWVSGRTQLIFPLIYTLNEPFPCLKAHTQTKPS